MTAGQQLDTQTQDESVYCWNVCVQWNQFLTEEMSPPKWLNSFQTNSSAEQPEVLSKYWCQVPEDTVW